MPAITFDHQTANLLRELAPNSSFHFESGDDAFSLALKRERSVLLVPGAESGMALVLQMKRAEAINKQPAPQPQVSQQETSQPRQTQAHKPTDQQREERREEGREPRGILGLDGDAVYLDEGELEAQQRPWWQRLFRS